ncbi:HEAT repeat domain-containing protein [Glycomyces buryatensis]|uniref:HEAT repeat domain-containing protein n=1 Tax=Glycomyces buryatensis TaxID=2570927 RepID=A0A4S8QEF9_9ACTN|nr:hypothetical protein [Glycomyces buryatensis]THV42788.1 hypothetical protein FAB82_04525 [Glycomyces buryatensis]
MALVAAGAVIAVVTGLYFTGHVSGEVLALMSFVAMVVALPGLLIRKRAPMQGWPAAMERARFDRKTLSPYLPAFDELDGVPSMLRKTPRILRYFNASADRGKAEAALDELLSLGPNAWPAFDQAVRNWTRFRSGGTDLAMVGASMPETTLGLALAMASGDGYRRAEVLEYSNLAEHPRLYPMLLMRTVDHVAQVRALAIALLPGLLAASDDETLGAMLTVACRLRDRADAAPMLGLIIEALQNSNDETLLAVLAESDGRSARWAGRALTDQRRLQAPHLTAIATGRFDDRLQEACAEELADQAVSLGSPDALRPLMEARSGRVRAVVLTGLVRLEDFSGIEGFLTDRSAAVRATAQWGLRRAGQDPAAHYRALLQSPMISPKPTIQGLGECGQKTDADLVVPFLADPRPQTRAAVVNALKHLHADRELSGLLTDPAPSVTRAVVGYLLERRTLPSPAALRELMRHRHPVNVRRSAASLLREHGIWHRIWVELTLYDDPDTRLSEDGLRELDYMCRYEVASVTAPIDDRLRGDLRALVQTRANELYPDTRETLQWLLNTARPRAGPQLEPGPETA